MIRIAIIILLIPLIKSENCQLNDNDSLTLENSFNTAKDYIENSAIHDDSIICIGTSKAGKSTLVNYLIGNKLKGVQLSRYAEFKVMKADNQSSGPEIGVGPASKTKIPTKWTSMKIPNLTIWDTPGFDDNRGVIQELTNSMYFYQLMKNINSTKFLFIINFGDLQQDSNTPLIRDLNILENFFGDELNNSFSSITVIFSKVPYKLFNNEVNIAMIHEMLKEKIAIMRQILSNGLKKFVNFLLQCRNCIAIFRSTNTTSTIGYNLGFNIFQSIVYAESIKGSRLRNMGQSISDTTRYCFLQFKNGVTSFNSFNKLWTLLKIKLENKISICYNSAANDDKNTIETIFKNLTRISVLLNNSKIDENDLFKNMKIIETIAVDLIDENERSSAMRKIEFDIFASNLLAITENEDFNSNIKLNIRLIRKYVEITIHELSKLIDYFKQGQLYHMWHSLINFFSDLFDDSKKMNMK